MARRVLRHAGTVELRRRWIWPPAGPTAPIQRRGVRRLREDQAMKRKRKALLRLLAAMTMGALIQGSACNVQYPMDNTELILGMAIACP